MNTTPNGPTWRDRALGALFLAALLALAALALHARCTGLWPPRFRPP